MSSSGSPFGVVAPGRAPAVSGWEKRRRLSSTPFHHAEDRAVGADARASASAPHRRSVVLRSACSAYRTSWRRVSMEERVFAWEGGRRFSDAARPGRCARRTGSLRAAVRACYSRVTPCRWWPALCRSDRSRSPPRRSSSRGCRWARPPEQDECSHPPPPRAPRRCAAADHRTAARAVPRPVRCASTRFPARAPLRLLALGGGHAPVRQGQLHVLEHRQVANQVEALKMKPMCRLRTSPVRRVTGPARSCCPVVVQQASRVGSNSSTASSGLAGAGRVRRWPPLVLLDVEGGCWRARVPPPPSRTPSSAPPAG